MIIIKNSDIITGTVRKAGIIMGKFDEIFDDVVVNAKAAASAVSKKASDVYDASKSKITASEIRGDINEKLRELGALTYKSQLHGIDLSEKINKTISEITDLRETLNLVNQHIAETKNQKKCCHCGAKVPKNSLFCNICGGKLDDTATDDEFDI